MKLLMLILVLGLVIGAQGRRSESGDGHGAASGEVENPAVQSVEGPGGNGVCADEPPRYRDLGSANGEESEPSAPPDQSAGTLGGCDA